LAGTALNRTTIFALLLGAVHALSFAPDPLPAALLPWLQILSFSGLMMCLLRSPGLRHAAWYGWLFGLGNFCTGLYWLYISLHTYGGLAPPLAALAVLLFCAAMALYYALASGLTHWCLVGLNGLAQRPANPPSTPSRAAHHVLVALLCSAGGASSWTLCEWLRGTLLTGFPWLSLGYAHVDGPLHAWAPVVGVYGLGWLAAFISITFAVCMVWCWQTWQIRQHHPHSTKPASSISPPFSHAAACLTLTLLVLLCGVLLRNWQWAQPHGEPVQVRLVQGNISQSAKFDAHLMQQGLQRHMELALAPTQPDALPLQAILMPETVMTLLQDSYPLHIWENWQHIARVQNATLLLGAPLRRQRDEQDNVQLTNSVLALHAGSSLAALYAGEPELVYDKQHLVPFGEFVPRGFRWFVDALNIPLGDFQRGSLHQTPVPIAAQQLALNICYEDLFGEEIIHAVRPRNQRDMGAGILANVSNLGWFGNSWALRQHLQISRMRTLETARPMLRAANTGISALITADGKIQTQLPAHTHGVLDLSVQGYTGITPYVRWSNTPVLLISLVCLCIGLLNCRPHFTR